LYGCQFIYSSSHDNQIQTESPVHGGYGERMNRTHKYHLDDDERIKKVQVKSSPWTFLGDDGVRWTTQIIIGLKFITTKNRTVPSDIPLTGNDVESEYFPGYILGHVAGKSALRIDQLQFFWYRVEE
jgi:hypothetical protein